VSQDKGGTVCFSFIGTKMINYKVEGMVSSFGRGG